MDQLHAAPTHRAVPHPRIRGLAMGLGLLLAAASAGTVQAGHTLGTLDCGVAGTFEVDGTRPLPAGFEAPGPWSGLFLLEGTTKVFRALAIEGQMYSFSRPAAGKFPGAVVTCTLTSGGQGFPDGYWTMSGVLLP
jgi:hypothetical protein